MYQCLMRWFRCISYKSDEKRRIICRPQILIEAKEGLLAQNKQYYAPQIYLLLPVGVRHRIDIRQRKNATRSTASCVLHGKLSLALLQAAQKLQ